MQLRNDIKAVHDENNEEYNLHHICYDGHKRCIKNPHEQHAGNMKSYQLKDEKVEAVSTLVLHSIHGFMHGSSSFRPSESKSRAQHATE